MVDLETVRARLAAFSGRDWQGAAGAFMRAATDSDAVYPTVNAARADTQIVSTDASTAPAGAVHWFESQYGQVALDLDGGGTRVVAASRLVRDEVAKGVGVTSVKQLAAASPYIGWSTFYGQLSA